MMVLVCGSRTWTDADEIRRRLRRMPKGTVVIHGDARGADKMAAIIAIGLGFRVEKFPPDYKRYGRYGAPKKRNIQMLDEEPDLVIAFQKDGSTGTQHTIDNAIERGIDVEIFHAA